MTRRLIVNADDFGLSSGVNRGVVEAHVHGIVTSTSLMVRQPAAAEAADLAREHPRLGVGLHVDLGEWRCVDGEWEAVYEVVDTDDADAVAAEVVAQVEAFRSLLGHRPTHLDSHQHVHRSHPVRAAVLSAAAAVGAEVRDRSAAYVGDFYGQLATGEPCHDAITVDALTAVLRRLPDGASELACHPGYDDGLNTMYRLERELELLALCDPRVRAVVAAAGIELIGFADLS